MDSRAADSKAGAATSAVASVATKATAKATVEAAACPYVKPLPLETKSRSQWR